MDAVTKAILETIGAAGFNVNIEANSVTAIDQKTGERYIVRYADNLYDAVVELAQQIGIDLEDG